MRGFIEEFKDGWGLDKKSKIKCAFRLVIMKTIQYGEEDFC